MPARTTPTCSLDMSVLYRILTLHNIVSNRIPVHNPSIIQNGFTTALHLQALRVSSSYEDLALLNDLRQQHVGVDKRSSLVVLANTCILTESRHGRR